jgi:hypothetical protein
MSAHEKMTAEQRAREFVTTGFRDLDLPSLEPYIEIVAELIRGAEQDELKRIVKMLDDAVIESADDPDVDLVKVNLMRWIALCLSEEALSSQLLSVPPPAADSKKH